MRRIRCTRARLLVIGIAAAASVALASPAPATCLRGEVVVHFDSAPDKALLTQGQCLLWRPSGDVTEQHFNVDAGDGNLHPGAPSGAKVDVWVPWPL